MPTYLQCLMDYPVRGGALVILQIHPLLGR